LVTCAAFRVAREDDSLAAITRFGLRELAQRIQFLSERSRCASSASPNRSLLR